MSVRVMSAVWAISLPDSEKLVLLALADCANDEGGCWPSMTTLAAKCSKSDRTVQTAIKALVSKGHLTRTETLGKGCNYTVHPRKDFGAEAASPPKPLHPRSERREPPKPLRTKRKEPSLPKKDKPSLVAHEIPDDWEPLVFGIASQSRKVVDGWPPGELDRQLEHFRAHHRKKGDRFKSWQDAWSTWVLNSRTFGAQNGRTNGMGRHQPDDGLSATTRAANRVFADAIGPGERYGASG